MRKRTISQYGCCKRFVHRVCWKKLKAIFTSAFNGMRSAMEIALRTDGCGGALFGSSVQESYFDIV